MEATNTQATDLQLLQAKQIADFQMTPVGQMVKQFEIIQRRGQMFAQSTIVPDTYKNNVGNCVIALEMAERMGAVPLMVMQNLYIVHGNPAFSSKFLIASINAEDVMLKNPRHKAGKQVEADWELFKQYNEIKELKGKINELTARKSAIEDEMKLTMGDAEALVYGKETLATWKSAKDKPRFDEKGFSFAHPELYAEFQKTTPSSRRFLLK